MERVIAFIRASRVIPASLLLIVGVAAVVQGQSKGSKRVADATRQAQKAAQVLLKS